MTILFVCTGNTCRSPMAEAIYADLTDKTRARSAGFTANGNPASLNAQLVASERGLDLSHHRSQEINEELVEWADVILCMTENHRQALLQYYPNNKTFTLSDFARGIHRDIADPYGLDIDTYRQVFKELEMLINEIYHKEGGRI